MTTAVVFKVPNTTKVV